MRAYYLTYGLNTTITNCSNNFGPYQDPEKFIPRAITNLIADQPIITYGGGEHIRDWLYVEDHCRAIDLVIKKGKIGDTYLIGGMHEEIDNLKIAKILVKSFGKKEAERNAILDIDFNNTVSYNDMYIPDKIFFSHIHNYNSIFRIDVYNNGTIHVCGSDE